MTEVSINMSVITIPCVPSEVHFGRVTYPPGGTHGPRVQRGLQFVYLISGLVEIEIDGDIQRLLPGNMAILLPGRQEHFRFHSRQESEHSWCQLDFDVIESDFNGRFCGVSPQLPINTEIEQMMELGLAVTGASHIDTRIALIKLGEALLHYYLSLDALPANERPSPMPRAVRQACKYIASAYQHPLTLELIAQQAHCSVNHLINQFKHSLNVTPIRYLWQTRLVRAESLLKHTDIPIAAIAEQCGFASPFHFSRLFKESHQVSPRQYRAHCRSH